MPRRKIRPNLDVDITWDDVQNKPSTFPPSSHNHDERYYTETELQTSGQSQVHWNNISNKPSLITGSGTTNTIPKFTGTNAIGDSVIYESGGNVGIGTTTPSEKLNIVGNILFQASSASPGFMVGDRATTAGKQLFFQGTEGSHSVFNVGTKNATAASRKVSQISLWAVDINGSDIQNEVQFALQRPANVGSGVIFTQGFGTGENNAGDIYIEPKWNQDMASLGKFVVKQNGNVGIGTTSPEAKLAIIGGVNVGGNTNPGYGNLYVVNNCSADSFTDRTKGYDGDALAEIKQIKNKDGEIDHDTLPEFVKKDIKLTRVKEENGREIKEVTVTQGRDIGAMITMLTVAIQQIADRLEKLEAKIK